MKITKQSLKNIIKEEIQKIYTEDLEEVDAEPPRPRPRPKINPAIQALRQVQQKVAADKEEYKQQLVDDGMDPKLAEHIAHNYYVFLSTLKRVADRPIPNT